MVEEIRASRPDLPILLATGYASDGVRGRFAQDKAMQIVTKPFDPDRIVTALRQFGIGRQARE